MGKKKAGPVEEPTGVCGAVLASQFHGFFDAEFLRIAARTLALALRGILLRSILMGLALIPTRVSGLVLFFHWINRLTGRMSLETDCMGNRNVHRLFTQSGCRGTRQPLITLVTTK